MIGINCFADYCQERIKVNGVILSSVTEHLEKACGVSATSIHLGRLGTLVKG